MKGELAYQLLFLLLPLVASYVATVQETPSAIVPTDEESNPDPERNETSETSADDKDDSLALAIRTIYERAERAKREASGPHRPYSAYRPLATSHRYRYPLNKKRAYFMTPENSEDDFDSDFDGNDLVDYDDVEIRPSLFRERVSGASPSLISNAHFSDHSGKKKKSAGYGMEETPYDWDTIYRLYNQGKQMKSSRNLPIIQRFLEMVEEAKSKRDYAEMGENELQDYINNRGFGQPDSLLMNRRKRATGPASQSPLKINQSKFPSHKPLKNVSKEQQSGKVIYTPADSQQKTLHENHINTLQKQSTNHSRPVQIRKVPSSNHLKIVDRRKREFMTPYDDARAQRERENDFLTREYFKTIARSVGNKKKRMVQYENTDKRSSGFDALLDNPSMLQYVQEQIKETEEEVVQEAEELLQSHPLSRALEDEEVQALLSNSITKLDALEEMSTALSQLQHLQEEDAINKRAVNLASGYDREELKREVEKEKRRKALNERHDKREERRKKSDNVIEDLFGENQREECPVLERIVINCLTITELVGDESKVFLEPCLRHEICYMCGSGLDVSRHECDALLSSALEAGCSTLSPEIGTNSLECLSGAGETFNSLADPNRYDSKGICTHDPCVRQLLDSR